jgi:CRP-like cAMP-binding protein
VDPAVTQGAPVPPALEALQCVSWLAVAGKDALVQVAQRAQPVVFPAGKTILAELEAGDELYLFLSGEARVTVMAALGRRKEIGTLRAGDACGEISVLTHDLRSATVIATTEVRALRVDREGFEQLVARHPIIAVHFARLLSTRLQEADNTLDAIIESATWVDDPSASHPAVVRLEGKTTAALPGQATLGRAWRELVVSHRRELPFLALASFLAVLFLVREGIDLFAPRGDALFISLRTAYTSGIALVFLSTATALTRFRSRVQRVVAMVFGAGFALILNELSVFLAFDTFYLDMTRRDPAMVFSVETLYQRSESQWAVVLMLSLLFMLTYVRHFLRRALFMVVSRVRGRKPAEPPPA